VGLCLNWFFCSLKMHDESTKRQKVDDDVQEGALPPYLLDRDQTQRAKVN
jgi:ribosome biogenesis protein NSA2